ncbi:MAG: hypothetical protein DRP84_10250 [Spirochaetes bacterium]|nr:MAG: hypothetical protein DRP84_10250 [Spirochaetota bacterium]
MKRLVPPYEKHYRFREVSKHVTKKNARLLDVGCGDATLPLYLDDTIKYFGIDVNPKSNQAKKIDITKDKFPFKSDFFDYVVCTEVLEHIDNHQNCLSEVRRVLKPNGILVGTVPNCLAFPRIISFSDASLEEGKRYAVGENHIVAFGFPEIRDLLRTNKFKVLEQYYFYFIFSNRIPLSIPILDKLLKKFCFYIFFKAKKNYFEETTEVFEVATDEG